MATDEGLRYIDSDGHILEHPTAMPEYAPAEFRDRIWHVETDAEGHEWVVAEGHRVPAAVFSLAGVAGYSEEDKARALAGEFTYSEVSRRAWDPKLRLEFMDTDGIAASGTAPTRRCRQCP